MATDEQRVPIENARIYAGRYEVRVSPIADTDPSTTKASGTDNLDDQAEFAPGTYEFIAHAPGYGHVRFSETFKAGQNKAVRIRFPTNWASGARGATARGDGERLDDLVDDTEGTNWQFEGANVSGSQVTVDLAGDDPVQVRRVNVSALLRSHRRSLDFIIGPARQNRFTTLRQFAIEVSTDGVDFNRLFESSPDAFPGPKPRPAAPDMLLRSFDLPQPVSATYVRIVVLDNQCTGNPDFHGEQDNDPLNATDCRTDPNDPPESLPARDTTVRISELQVFSR